jgi:hypothetical protein
MMSPPKEALYSICSGLVTTCFPDCAVFSLEHTSRHVNHPQRHKLSQVAHGQTCQWGLPCSWGYAPQSLDEVQVSELVQLHKRMQDLDVKLISARSRHQTERGTNQTLTPAPRTVPVPRGCYFHFESQGYTVSQPSHSQSGGYLACSVYWLNK